MYPSRVVYTKTKIVGESTDWPGTSFSWKRHLNEHQNEHVFKRTDSYLSTPSVIGYKSLVPPGNPPRPTPTSYETVPSFLYLRPGPKFWYTEL